MEEELPQWVKKNGEGCVVSLYVQPGASRSEFIGEHSDGKSVRLKVRIAASPAENAANEALVDFLKKATNIPVSRIHLLRGATSRSKDFLLQGIAPQIAVQKLMPT